MSNLWTLTQEVPPDRTLRLPGETLPAMFWNGVAARGERVWMREKRLGLWHSWTWSDTGTAVREIAMGLAALDFEVGDTASVLANTRLEWVLADLAILSAGGVTNGIYPTDAPVQVQYLCADSDTSVLFVEDEEQLDKVLDVRETLPRLRRIVVIDMEGLHRFADPMVLSLEALRERGRQFDAAHAGEFERRCASRQPQDLAILVYTSGTTGRPKGAMHSHQGLISAVRNATVRLPFEVR